MATDLQADRDAPIGASTHEDTRQRLASKGEVSGALQLSARVQAVAPDDGVASMVRCLHVHLRTTGFERCPSELESSCPVTLRRHKKTQYVTDETKKTLRHHA